MSAFLQLTLALAIIILAAKAGGLISVRLRQPAVLGELIMGVLLGPTIIDLVHLPFVSDPTLLHEEISGLATLGVGFVFAIHSLVDFSAEIYADALLLVAMLALGAVGGRNGMRRDSD